MIRFVAVPGEGRGPIETGHGAIRAAAAWVDEGRILAHPTSTVYGIGARPEPALDREIARLKGRDPESPLIVIGANTDALRRAFPGLAWSAAVDRLAAVFWPGPLTIVVPPADEGDAPGVAVRVDGHPVVRQVLAESGGVMTSTSLNRTGEPPTTDGREARTVLETLHGTGRVPLALLDAGDLGVARPSTIVAIEDDGVRLIREGAVAWREVTSVVSAERTGS